MTPLMAAGEAPAAPRAPSPWPLIAIGTAIAALLAASAWWIGGERAGAEQARGLVRGSYERRIAIAELLGGLERAETAQRGYVITGSPAFLAPFRPARATLRREFELLGRAYVGQPAQRQRLALLDRLIAAKFAEMEEVIRRRDTLGPAAAVARVSDNRGRVLMERARAVAAEAIAEEEATLRAGIAADARQADQDRILLVVLLAAGLLAALLAIAFSWRARMSRYRLERAAHDVLVRLSAIFASTTDAILILNPSGTIETVNATTGRLLGYATADLARRDIDSVVQLTDGEGSFEQRLGIVDGVLRNPFRVDRIAIHRDGHAVPVDVALGVMPLAEGLHIVALLRDVSERKQAERAKDEFISTVSHELRTPLTSVIGSLGLLAAEAAGVLPDPARRLVEIAENNSHRLIRLINDILDIDRIGSGRATLERHAIDVAALAQRAAEDAQGLAAARRVTVATSLADGAMAVLGDHDRLLQVLGNLLSNAIRFSPEGRTVRLTVEPRDGRVRLCIDDDGPGVAPEFRERLFRRFAQADAGAAIPGGSGLGLAISREIVRAHGGELVFENREEGGARFCVVLTRHYPRIETDRADRPRILICEDDPDAVAVLRQMIEQLGCATHSCGTAREAQAIAQGGGYDGVVLDLKLPDASGLAAVRALRALPGTRALPLIVVSAFARATAAEATAHALDVVDWIDKPVDADRLRHAIEAAIARTREDRPTLLHVDDDPDMLEVTALALADQGRMLSAKSIAAARSVLAERTPDIVILDLNLPDGSGLDLLPDLFAEDGAAVPTVLYSATEPDSEIGRQFDAVLVKSRRSPVALSDAIAGILARRRARRGEDA